MNLGTHDKQPADVKDYPIDYSAWLAEASGDTLNGATAAAVNVRDPLDTSLVVNDTEVAQSAARVWLSGGTDGQKYKVTVNVTTVGGRTDQSEFYIKVKDN